MNPRRCLERALTSVLAEIKPMDDGVAPDGPERARLLARLEQLHDALDREEEGVYGLCVGCGRPIQIGRLETHPETETSVSCEEGREARASTRRVA